MSHHSKIHLRIPLKDNTPQSVINLFKALPNPPEVSYGGYPHEVADFFRARLAPQLSALGSDKANFQQFLEEDRFIEIASTFNLSKSCLDHPPYILILSHPRANHAIYAFHLLVETVLPHYITDQTTLLGMCQSEDDAGYRPVWTINGQPNTGPTIEDEDYYSHFNRRHQKEIPEAQSLTKDSTETLDHQGDKIRACVEAMAKTPGSEDYHRLGDQLEPIINQFFDAI